MAFPACLYLTVGGSRAASRALQAGPSKMASTMPQKRVHSTKSWRNPWPRFTQPPEHWARLMRTTLAFNGSYFNTNRMVKQYTRNSYYPVKLIEPAKVEEEAY